MSKNSKEDLSEKIKAAVLQAINNLENSDDPSLMDEILVCQYRLLEQQKEVIDELRRSVALWGHKFDILETRLQLKGK